MPSPFAVWTLPKQHAIVNTRNDDANGSIVGFAVVYVRQFEMAEGTTFAKLTSHWPRADESLFHLQVGRVGFEPTASRLKVSSINHYGTDPFV